MVLWGDQGQQLASALVAAGFLSRGKDFPYSG